MIYLKGRKALEELAKTNDFAFHGSQNGKLTQLKPIAGGSKRYNTQTGDMSVAETLVYATKHLDSAIFVATIWRRVGASGWSTNGVTSDEVDYEFHASPEAIAEAAKPNNVGFVYVLDVKLFSHDDENPYELVSKTSVKPYAVVEVSASDLRPDFKTLGSPPRHA
jgi:hypothetical protein